MKFDISTCIRALFSTGRCHVWCGNNFKYTVKKKDGLQWWKFAWSKSNGGQQPKHDIGRNSKKKPCHESQSYRDLKRIT